MDFYVSDTEFVSDKQVSRVNPDLNKFNPEVDTLKNGQYLLVINRYRGSANFTIGGPKIFIPPTYIPPPPQPEPEPETEPSDSNGNETIN